MVQGQRHLPGRSAGAAHRGHHRFAIEGLIDQFGVQHFPGGNVFAAQGHDFVTGLQLGLRRNAVGGGRGDHGAHALDADHENQPVKGNGENEIEHRAGRDDHRALAHRLRVKRQMALVLGHLAFAAVEHLDVTAQRNG